MSLRDLIQLQGKCEDIESKEDHNRESIKNWQEISRKLEAACDSLCTERNQFELKYCDEKRKSEDLKILLDANKERADKAEFNMKKFGIKLKLAIVLLNEAAPIMEKHYLRKRWFESVNKLNNGDS